MLWKNSLRLGSGSGKFFGDESATSVLVQVGIISSGDTQTGISRHPIQSLRHRPFFLKAHLTEALDLDGMEGLKFHGDQGERLTADDADERRWFSD